MKKVALLAAALIAVACLLACNKQTPPKLDYSEKLNKGVYDAKGLPGDGHVGGTPLEDKYHGYHGGDEHGTKAPPPTDKQPTDKQPTDKAPAKPEGSKAE
jgi:hypothetical protein